MKGQKFDPDERLKKILTDAVAIGNAYARVNTVYPLNRASRSTTTSILSG